MRKSSKSSKKKLVVRGSIPEEVHVEDSIDELSGKLKKDDSENKLMSSVLPNDKEKIHDGKLLNESINQGIGTFNPDIMYEKLVSNYKIAEQLYGKTLLRQLSGFSADYIERNIRIPEFQTELRTRLQKKNKELQKKGLLDKDRVTEEGYKLASLVMYKEELDALLPKGTLGKRIHKKLSVHGSKGDAYPYKKGDKYRDIAFKQSIGRALRRRHVKLRKADLRTFERKAKGSIVMVYAVDASASMKGKKIEKAKKAGVALAYNAIKQKDKVGLMVFNQDVDVEVRPTLDFSSLLHKLVPVTASRQTDIALMLKKAISLFPRTQITKHLLLITDAQPTTGEYDDVEKATLEAVSQARSAGITISVVGIELNRKGKQLARKITEIGLGKVYLAKTSKALDVLVLEDYYSL